MIKSIFKQIFTIMTNRLLLLGVVVAVLFYILVVRLFELQIIEGEALNEAFSLRVIRERDIQGIRGTIYDRSGYALAENILAFTVKIDGSIYVADRNQMLLDLYTTIESHGDQVISGFPITLDINNNFVYQVSAADIAEFKRQIFHRGLSTPMTLEQEQMTAQEMFYYVSENLFNLSLDTYTVEEVIKILNIRYPLWIRRYYQYQLSTVAININDRTLAALEENMWRFPGVTIIEDPLRVYHDPYYFAHIMGYTREISAEQLIQMRADGYQAGDIVGATGMESVMELSLRGANGSETVEVDNLGRTMSLLTTVSPSIGNDVFLTIDRDLQILSYEILEKQIANILQKELVYTQKDATSVVLMKDIFLALTRQDDIDINGLITSQRTASTAINAQFSEAYGTVVRETKLLVQLESVLPTSLYNTYLNYFLDAMVRYGILNLDYLNSEAYEAYTNQTIGFRSLITAFLDEDLIYLYDDYDTVIYPTPLDYLLNYLMDAYTQHYEFKRMILLDLLEAEAIPYRYLNMLLMEQDVIAMDEAIYDDLDSRRLDPLDHMKQVLLNLEILPSRLALDPSSGSVVVVDVHSGDVLALVSYPSYDNNHLVNGFDYNYYLSLLNDPNNPLFPRATHSKTAPGSTFKMVSALAGLGYGVIDTRSNITCQGIYTKIWPSAKCWIHDYGRTHGPIPVRKAVEVSCNYFFYEVGYRLAFNPKGEYDATFGLERLNTYVSYMGLDQRTGIQLQEVSSNISTVDPSRTAIGQSGNNYTPIQIARYIATLANGGTLYDLSVLKQIMAPNGSVLEVFEPRISMTTEFDPDHLSAVHLGMLDVTVGANSSSRSYFYDFPISMAGKTGTAQESPVRAAHSNFVAFAPFDAPEIAVITIIPFGFGSANAISVGRDVIAAYYQLDIKRPDYKLDFMLEDVLN